MRLTRQVESALNEADELQGEVALTGADGDLSPRRPRRLRLPKRIRIGLVGLFGFAVVLGTAGAMFEALSARGDADRYPAPGQMVDVGGTQMHISCTGSGSPTVILDAGLSGSSLDWGLVQPSIAASTRVCSYDRAGMGWSDSVSEPRSPAQIASELHALLTEAAIAPPYVLVGHSLAGKNVRMFAIQHPDEVAGMVLVDARSELVDDQASDGEMRMVRLAGRVQGWAYRFARRIGLSRLSGATLLGYSVFGEDVGRVMALKVTDADAVATSTRELVERSRNDDELRAAPSLGDMPLVVLASGRNMSGLAFWSEGQNALAALSARGRLVVVEGSGHYIHIDRPAEVIDAIEEVTASARLRASTGMTTRDTTTP